MSSSQWHDDQSHGERALREFARRAKLDTALGVALRESGVTVADALAIQTLYSTAGQDAGRIVVALRAIETWIRNGGMM